MFKSRHSIYNYGEPRRSRRPGLLIFSVVTALWWTLVFDIPYWNKLSGLLPDGAWMQYAAYGSVLFFVALSLITALSFLPRWIFRILMTALALIGGGALCGSLFYGAVIDPSMMRNVLATNSSEAGAYLSLRTVSVYLLSTLPLVLWTFWLAPKPVPARRWGWLLKAAGMIAALVAGAGLIALNFQSYAGVNRTDRTLRYHIAPVNIIYSTAKTFISDDSPDSVKVRTVIDPSPERTVKTDTPTLFVVLVGETTRAANWELNGYARETNPELKKLPVINFSDAMSCGTSTDVSVPCMMSRVGRFNYDRKRIISEETLPTILQKAGYRVVWVDNQGGCKGACTEVESVRPKEDPALCSKGECLDGVFFNDVKEALASLKPGQPTVLFLHMMGSHGPKYYDRSPEDMKVFKPECRDADLASCKKEEIVNAFDNSVRYTDHVIATIIRQMQARPEVAGGLLFMSDHGESLGEHGLFLHGAPWMVAPKEQTHIPFVMWISPAFAKTYGVDMKVLEKAASKPSSQDNLFSTMLGLLKVKSSVYDAKLDLSAPKTD